MMEFFHVFICKLYYSFTTHSTPFTTKINALKPIINMATSTSEHPPIHSDDDFEHLHATRLSDCSRCASSKPTKIVTAVAKMQPQNESPLLRLPAELRETVYSYVFVAKESTSHDQKMTISEARSAKPASDLLRTCQIIFQEAHCAFEVARTKYWSKTVNIIYIHLKNPPVSEKDRKQDPVRFSFRDYKSLARDSINELHDRELQHVQGVVITVTLNEPTRLGVSLEWRLSSCCRQAHNVHKYDWVLSGTAHSVPMYLSTHTFTRPGKSWKPESLINMVGHLGAYYRVVQPADVHLLSPAVTAQDITPSRGQSALIQIGPTIISAPGPTHFYSDFTLAEFSRTSSTTDTIRDVSQTPLADLSTSLS